MSDQHLMFDPTLSGTLHIGNALILSLVADEAERIGASVIEFLDAISPWNTEYDNADAQTLELRTRKSLDQANKLLDVRPTAIIHRHARRDRYMSVAHDLVRRRKAVEIAGGTIMLKSSVVINDRAYGPVWEFAAPIVWRGTPYSNLVAVVDSLDFDIPIWIDDITLMCEAFSGRRLWAEVTDSPPPEPWRVPTITDATGEPLHKRTGIPPEYQFHIWARQFQTAKERRGVLRGMIMQHVRGFQAAGRERILTVGAVHIDEHGARVGMTPLAEIGQYEREPIR